MMETRVAGRRTGAEEPLQERLKPHIPTSARTVAKRALRGFAVATSPLRRLPGFLILGTRRGGTTSLFNYLLEHPSVAPLFPSAQNIKGVHYFDKQHAKGRAWYRSHFPTVIFSAFWRVRGYRMIAGEASPYYLFHPWAPQRAHELVPHAKLIVLLRNPVDRAYSHYRERVRNGVEDLTFEEAIEREPARLAGELDR